MFPFQSKKAPSDVNNTKPNPNTNHLFFVWKHVASMEMKKEMVFKKENYQTEWTPDVSSENNILLHSRLRKKLRKFNKNRNKINRELTEINFHMWLVKDYRRDDSPSYPWAYTHKPTAFDLHHCNNPLRLQGGGGAVYLAWKPQRDIRVSPEGHWD